MLALLSCCVIVVKKKS